MVARRFLAPLVRVRILPRQLPLPPERVKSGFRFGSFIFSETVAPALKLGALTKNAKRLRTVRFAEGWRRFALLGWTGLAKLGAC